MTRRGLTDAEIEALPALAWRLLDPDGSSYCAYYEGYRATVVQQGDGWDWYLRSAQGVDSGGPETCAKDAARAVVTHMSREGLL